MPVTRAAVTTNQGHGKPSVTEKEQVTSRLQDLSSTELSLTWAAQEAVHVDCVAVDGIQLFPHHILHSRRKKRLSIMAVVQQPQ